ncbi:MAG: alpha/beta hydrolase [Actinobacteria bacterium]|nr:alpha/beta hydrolase [Actinomycetota bacterium]
MTKRMATLISLIALISIGLAAALLAKPNNKVEPTPSTSPSVKLQNFGKLSKFYSQQLKWTKCGDGFECTRLEVPLDYLNPKSESIFLQVVQHQAPPGMSRGSLVVNPGGPGGSGIDYALAVDYIMTPLLRDNFDVVGFDPRGVGKSNPIKCLSDKQLDTLLSLDPAPDNAAEIARMQKLSKSLGQGCLTRSPKILKYMDTVSAAKDIDILRQALGDEKLNWFGKSYGTFLGATYADLFPKRVGRMMLDGAIDPKLSLKTLALDQAVAFEMALRRFVVDCAAEAECPLSKNSDTALAQISGMFKALDRKPAKLDGGRIFTEGLAFTGVLGNLYDKQYGWPELRSALLTALEGDYTSLAASADRYISRDTDGHYTDNGNEAIYAVSCLDRPDRTSLAQTISYAQAWSKKAPVFGAPLAWSNLGCTYWPVKGTGRPKAISAKGSQKILVLGTKYDPATPYAWAQALNDQLANSELLTYIGDGHTAYFQGSDCIDNYVDQYFLIGRARTDVTCSDGP